MIAIGDCIRIRSFEHVGYGGKLRAGFKAGKGEVFLAILIGHEPATALREDSQDPIEMMRALGWAPSAEIVNANAYGNLAMMKG